MPVCKETSLRDRGKLKWRTLKIFPDIKKRWFFVIGLYSFPFFLGELTIIGYLMNSFLLQIGIISAGVAFSLWFVGDSIATTDASKLGEAFQRRIQITAAQKNLTVWLVFHKILQIMEIFSIALPLLAIIIGSLIETIPESGTYYSIWWLLCSCLAFPYFHRVRNVLGMQCTAIQGGSLLGARAFSRLASQLLAEKNKRGLRFLGVSLRMLKRGFKSKSIRVDNMDKTLEMAFIVSNLDCIPYKLLTSLSENIANASSLSSIPEHFHDFVENEELAFAKRFKKIERPHGTAIWLPRISLIGVLVTALGTLIQAIMPESLRENVASFLSQVFGSPSILMLIIALALMVALFYYISRFSETNVSWKTLKGIKTT